MRRLNFSVAYWFLLLLSWNARTIFLVGSRLQKNVCVVHSTELTLLKLCCEFSNKWCIHTPTNNARFQFSGSHRHFYSSEILRDQTVWCICTRITAWTIDNILISRSFLLLRTKPSGNNRWLDYSGAYQIRMLLILSVVLDPICQTGQSYAMRVRFRCMRIINRHHHQHEQQQQQHHQIGVYSSMFPSLNTDFRPLFPCRKETHHQNGF